MTERLKRYPKLDRPAIVMGNGEELLQQVGFTDGQGTELQMSVDLAEKEGLIFKHPRKKIGIAEAIKNAIDDLRNGK